MTRAIGCLALIAAVIALLISYCRTQAASLPAGTKGMALYVEGSYPDFYPKVDRVITEAAGLGADALEVAYPFFMTGPYASAVTTTSKTPTTAELRHVIMTAHAHHMVVTLKPLLFEGPELLGLWRGAIQPADVGQWFDSYTVTVLQPAAALNPDILVVGAELNSLEGETYHWFQVLNHLPSGVYTYAQNWDKYAITPDWFSRLAFRSVDAYAPASAPNQVGLAVNAGDSVAEVGLDRYAGAYKTPWAISKGPVADGLGEQLAYFQAACDAYVKPAVVRSVFFWTLSLDAGEGFTLNGTPAEEVIRNCFA